MFPSSVLGKTGLFSQQLLGVSIMPLCVGCSVRILIASLVIIFRNYHFYYSVFGTRRKCFFIQCEISEKDNQTTLCFQWDYRVGYLIAPLSAWGWVCDSMVLTFCLGLFICFERFFFSCSPEFWRECDCLAKEHLGLVTYSDPLVGNLPILCSGGLVCYLGRVMGFGLCVLVSRRRDVLSGFQVQAQCLLPARDPKECRCYHILQWCTQKLQASYPLGFETIMLNIK